MSHPSHNPAAMLNSLMRNTLLRKCFSASIENNMTPVTAFKAKPNQTTLMKRRRARNGSALTKPNTRRSMTVNNPTEIANPIECRVMTRGYADDWVHWAKPLSCKDCSQ
jgi:hypothetical protein